MNQPVPIPSTTVPARIGQGTAVEQSRAAAEVQAAVVFGERYITWSCNQIREVLPDLGTGFLGAAINSLRTAGIIQHTGQYVPSTSAATHGHPIAVWTLTAKGRLIAAQRRAARTRKAAAA